MMKPFLPAAADSVSFDKAANAFFNKYCPDVMIRILVIFSVWSHRPRLRTPSRKIADQLTTKLRRSFPHIVFAVTARRSRKGRFDPMVPAPQMLNCFVEFGHNSVTS